MDKVHIIPKDPNNRYCVTLGSFSGKPFIAYGCGKKVCFIHANTLFLHQLTEDQESEISHLAFSRTGGRLAVGLVSQIKIMIPSDFVWVFSFKIQTSGNVTKLSWSSFGDCLFVSSNNCSLWKVPHEGDAEVIWTIDKNQIEDGSLSPDGRLLALIEDSKVLIYYKDTDFFNFKLNHQAKVSHISWKDLKTMRLYMDSYNPNSLLVALSDGWIKVWSEYYSPTGIGFNIVFQVKSNGGIASWIFNYLNLENQFSALSAKKESMKKLNIPIKFSLHSESCLIRSEKSQPETLIYGAVIKDKIPVEWLVILEQEKVLFYSCEGLGAYPVTAINIKLSLEIPFSHPIWAPRSYPLYILKEWDEIQMLGLNNDLDLVRWRKKFDRKNDDLFELTAVRGGHTSDIVKIISHPNVPLICSIDIQGNCRIWSCTRGLDQDKNTVQHLMPWGIVSGKVHRARWLDNFAILITSKISSAEVVKWQSPGLAELQMPSMRWEKALSWDVNCSKIECSKLDIEGKTFTCSVLCAAETEISVWKLKFNEEFSVEPVWKSQDVFKDAKVYSRLSDSDKWKTILYTATKGLVEARDLAEPEVVIWSKGVHNPVEILVSSFVSVVFKEKVTFFTYDGVEIGQIEDLYDKKLIGFTQGEVDCFGFFCKGTLTVMARRPPKMVSESELVWDQLCVLNFQENIENISVNIFEQYITSTKSSLQVFTLPESSSISQAVNDFSDVKPVFHPLFLLELLRTQQDTVVKQILSNIYLQAEELSFSLKMTIKDFTAPSNCSFDEDRARDIKKVINDKCMELPALKGDVQLIGQLMGIADIVSVMEAQSRSLDEFGKVFFLNVKMFKFANEQKLPAALKPSCLSSMEIAWALHSDQQDTFFSLFFTNLHEWSTIKMYGIGIWLKNPLKLKKIFEELALAEFRKNKEPKNVALWYLALGKKTIITELFKKDPDGVKIYNFMKNDFSSSEWKVKAQKNAFELRRQGKFELSAAFFLLANDSLSAVEVLAESLFDPQLALVIARLKEGEKSDLYRKVINDYFLLTALKEKDPWLTSISYYLLGNFSESIRCLDQIPDPRDIVPKCWNKNTAPTLSGFHPSIRRYIKLVRNTIPVKRDCEEKQVNLNNLDNVEKDLAARSARSYLRCGLPILALIEILKDPSDYDLIFSAVKKYLMVVSQNVNDINDDQQFEMLLNEVKYCSQTFSVPIKKLIEFVSSYFYKRNFRSIQCKFLIGCGHHVKGAEALLHQSASIHMILSRISRDPSFRCSQEALLNLSSQMKSCVKVLVSQKEGIDGTHKSQLIQIGLALYINLFIQCYQNVSCMSALQCLQALDVYLNTLEFTDINIEKSNNDYSIITTWLRFLMTNKLLKILEKFKSRDVDLWLENSLKSFNLIDACDKTAECSLAPGRGLKKRPLMSINKLKTRLKSMIRRIMMQINSFVGNNDSKLAQNTFKIFTRKQGVLPGELSFFFRTADDFSDFDLYFEGNSQLYRLIQASAQSLSNFIYENPGKLTSLENSSAIYQESIQENVNLFKNGLELFKSRDSVQGFALDNTDKKHLVVISSGKKDKIREINVEQSLIFKKLNSDLELETEDPESYQECIKQFDQLSDIQAYIYNPSISAVLSHLYTPQAEEFEEEIRLPPVNWHRSPLKPLLSSLSSYKSRQEKAEKVTSHPMLPVYVTGNEILTLWQFDRMESLQDFTTSPSPSRITSIKFNSYGDKLGAADGQGNIYLYKFDLQPTSFQPQIIIKSQSHLKASNFCFLNLGSVVASTGIKPKPFLSIHDTLMPGNRAVHHVESTGGKLLSFVSRYQQLLLAGNAGKIVKYDLRMRDVVEQIDTKHEDISDLKTGPGDISFFSGGTEGLVKVWDTAGNSVREVIDVCRKSKNKGVSQIDCVENSLFVSTVEGSVKLLRVIQY